MQPRRVVDHLKAERGCQPEVAMRVFRPGELHAVAVAMRRALSVGLALTLLATVAWGQTPEPERWFRVSWAPPPEGPVSTIKGSVFNDSPYRVTDVRLQIEGLDADRHPVGRTLAWAVGDIAPGGQTSFAAEPVPGAVGYQITVVSYDLVSLDQVR
jgi:hypothetical protein